MQKKNDLTTLLFLLIGLVAVVDLVFVQLRQQANEARAKQKLDCVVAVVEGAQKTTGFNGKRDAAMLTYLETGNSTDLRALLQNPPPPLPQCEIAWDK